MSNKQWLDVGEPIEFATSDNVKIIIQRKLQGERSLIDVRKWVKLSNRDVFVPTQKGVFSDVDTWKDKIIPALNALLSANG